MKNLFYIHLKLYLWKKQLLDSLPEIAVWKPGACSHLPLQSFRLQAKSSSAVVTFQLDRVVRCGQGRLSIGGCLKRSILQEKTSHEHDDTRTSNVPDALSWDLIHQVNTWSPPGCVTQLANIVVFPLLCVLWTLDHKTMMAWVVICSLTASKCMQYGHTDPISHGLWVFYIILMRTNQMCGC